MKKPLIGAHISTAGGIINSVQRALDIGAECLQIFAGSPRRYDVYNLEEEVFKDVAESYQKNNLNPVFLHASYLINLASEDPQIYQKSVKSICDNLIFASKIKAKGLIYHPGSPKGKDKKAAIEREIKALKDILRQTPSDSTIFIENTAGLKKIGTNEEEVGYILEKAGSSRLMVCLDTAHALESGNIINFSEESIENWLSRWKSKMGIDKIGAFHINDSLTAAQSHHDRHANIGEGFIGREGFLNLMKRKEAKNIPWIIEVPGFDKNGPDKKNIDILKNMRDQI